MACGGFVFSGCTLEEKNHIVRMPFTPDPPISASTLKPLSYTAFAKHGWGALHPIKSPAPVELAAKWPARGPGYEVLNADVKLNAPGTPMTLTFTLAVDERLSDQINNQQLRWDDTAFLSKLAAILEPDLVLDAGSYMLPGVVRNVSTHVRVKLDEPKPMLSRGKCYNCGRAPSGCLCPKGLVAK